MRAERLELADFRNYRAAGIALSPGTNLLIGRNSQGKTNLLEAVYCLTGLGSPRGPEAALVRQGAERALLHAAIGKGQRSVDVDLEIRPGRGPRALIGKTPVSGTRALSEVCAAVFFGPDELSLVKGSPEGRRRFVDDLAVKQRPARFALRREWERVLKQRNALLKSMPGGSASATGRATLEVWDEAFIGAGAALTAARLASLCSLAPYATKRYEEIAGRGRVELGYSSGWLEGEAVDAAEPPEEGVLSARLRDALVRVREKEIERGMSLVGPQRDDVTVKLWAEEAVLDARSHASQGDQRTIALALKLGEHDLLTETLGERPILLLDDVFSELDPSRREWLGDAVRGLGQTLLTSAEPGAVEATDADLVVEVAGGRLGPR